MVKGRAGGRRFPGQSAGFALAVALALALGVACAGRSVTRSEHEEGSGGSAGGSRSTGGSGGAVGGGPAGGSGGTPSSTNGGGSDGAGSSGSSGATVGGSSGMDASSGSSAGGVGGTRWIPPIYDRGGNGGMSSSPFPCYAQAQWSTNVELCKHGFLHLLARSCPWPERDAEGGAPAAGAAGEGSEPSVECRSDDDCGRTSYCVVEKLGGGRVVQHCREMCETYDDCSGRETCVCQSFQRVGRTSAEELGICVPATCRADAQCDEGMLCIDSLQDAACASGPTLFACQTPEDQCASASDCDEGRVCYSRGSGSRECRGDDCL